MTLTPAEHVAPSPATRQLLSAMADRTPWVRLQARSAFRLCFWGYGRKSNRCREQAIECVDRPKTRAYYCPEHAEEVRRLYAGSGR